MTNVIFFPTNKTNLTNRREEALAEALMHEELRRSLTGGTEAQGKEKTSHGGTEAQGKKKTSHGGTGEKKTTEFHGELTEEHGRRKISTSNSSILCF